MATGRGRGRPGRLPGERRLAHATAHRARSARRRPTREQAERGRRGRASSPGGSIPGPACCSPPSGAGTRGPATRDLPIGGVSALDRPIDERTDAADDKGGPGDETPAARRWAREDAARRARAQEAVAATKDRSNSVAKLAPVAELRPDGIGRHEGSVAGLSDWERWLELCARIDGFPRHLSIHSGGMLVTAAPLIDIAPIERATMQDRVVVQYDKRDVETMKLIKLDLLGLGMLAAIDECVQLIEHDCAVCLDLDRIPEEIPEVFEMLQAADTVGVFQVESRAQMQTLPKSRPGEPRRPRRGGGDHPARPDPGQRRPPVPAPQAGPRAGHVPPPEPRAGPPRHARRDPLPGAGDEDRDRRRGLHAGRARTGSGGRWARGARAREMEKLHARVRRGLHREAGPAARRRRGAVPPVRRVRLVRLRQEPRRRVRADRVRVELPQAVLPGPVRRRADQRPADGLLPGRGADQRREAPRRRDPAGRRQPERLRDDDRVGGAARLGAGGRRRRRRVARRRTPASRCRTGWGSTRGRDPCARRRA